MKRKYPLSIIVTVLSLILIIGIAIWLKDTSHQGTIHCETLLGDKSILDGMKVETVSKSDTNFDMKQTMEFGKNDKVSTDITTYFHHSREYGDSFFDPCISTGGQIEELKRRFRTDNTDIQMSKVIPYIYPEIQFFPDSLSLSNTKTPPRLKIETPSNVCLHVNKDEYGNIYFDGEPWFDMSCFYAKVQDTLYFTYSNAGLDHFEYNGVKTKLHYSGISGLYSVHMNNDFPQLNHYNSSIENYEYGVKSLIEIPVSDDLNVAVVGLDAVFDQTCIALSVVENSSLFIYLYRVTDDSILGPYKIMDFTNEDPLLRVRVRSNENLLTLEGDYGLEYGEHRFYVAGRLNDQKNLEILLSHKSSDPQVRKIFEVDADLEIVDMLYKEDKIYCLISYTDRRFSWSHPYNYLLAVSDRGIDYLGRMWTDFSEDMTIGANKMGDDYFLSLQDRTYGNIHFIKEND